ncbi:hypothetical protein H4R34_000235 [Dimargaris verticillata]|uniref:WD40-repeat-containing domain protein n=1 Tax=Dimargaris verticillata TaxID=2761393 RepID=A0A9W8B8H5_9FUNG|nr:hypothetical protein H4R34_000235 [Dimargaris verticillata]
MGIALSQNGKYMAIADDSGIPKVFDMHTRKPTQRRFRKKHSNLCMCVAFCCHFSTDLWTGGMDACQYQWDFTRALPMAKWAGQSMAATAASGGAIPMFNPPFVYSLAVHPNGRQVVAGLGTGAIRVLQWQSLPTPAPAPPVSSASKQPKGKSAKHKKPASTKPEEGWVEQLWLQDGHSYTVSALDYANDTGSYLVSGGLDGKLAIWEPNTPTASGEAPSEGSEAAVAAPFRLQKTAPTVFDKVECLVVVGPDPSENTGCQTTAAKADVTDQLGALSLGSARDSIIAVGGTAPGTNFSGRIALYQLQC